LVRSPDCGVSHPTPKTYSNLYTQIIYFAGNNGIISLLILEETTMSKVKPIPEGYHTITPYMLVERANKFIDFLKEAFDATVTFAMRDPEGEIKHAEIKIKDSMLMIAEPKGDQQPMPFCFYLYVEDVDSLYQTALKAGAISLREPADQFYGDRSGGVKDHFGNIWWIGSRIENLSSEEIQKRARAFYEKER
jgi:PhnB protein